MVSGGAKGSKKNGKSSRIGRDMRQVIANSYSSPTFMSVPHPITHIF